MTPSWSRAALNAATAPRSPAGLRTLSAALSLAVFFTIFDLQFVLGVGPFWDHPHQDHAQNLAGLYFFVQDAWRIPIFFVPRLGIPEGAVTIFADLLPAGAIVWKLLRSIPWLPPHFFGLWYLLAYVLQGVVFASLLIRAGCRSYVTCMCGTLLALAFPVWCIRFHHAAMSGHFMVVLALLLYLRASQRPLNLSYFAASAGYLVLTLLVNAYFFIIGGAIVAAALAVALLRRHVTRQRAAAFALVLGVIVAGELYVTGYVGGPAPVRGMPSNSVYSLNLLSFVLPQQEQFMVFPPSRGLLPFGLDWRRTTGGQYEGDNYLGLGVLLLLAATIGFQRPRLIQMLRRHWPLVLALAILGAYAVSPLVYLGPWKIVDLRPFLPAGVTVILDYVRAAGRLAWPIGYAALAAGIVLAMRGFSPRVAVGVLVAATLLNIADTQPARSFTRRLAQARVHNAMLVTALDQPIWRKWLSESTSLWVFPSFACMTAYNTLTYAMQLELEYMASGQNLPTNTDYLSRPNKDCGREALTAKAGVEDAGALVVYVKPDHPAPAEPSKSPLRRRCFEFDLGYVCSRHFTEGTAPPGFTPLVQRAESANTTLQSQALCDITANSLETVRTGVIGHGRAANRFRGKLHVSLFHRAEAAAAHPGRRLRRAVDGGPHQAPDAFGSPERPSDATGDRSAAT